MKETRSGLKAFLSTLCLFVTLAVLTMNFQNCSGVSSANFGSDEDSVSQGESGLIPIGGDGRTPITDVDPTTESESLTAIFLSGDVFNHEILVSEGSFLDSLIEVIDYKNYRKGKAVAVAQNGLGYAALTQGSDSEARRMAVETCNFISGKDCAVIISGDLYVVDSSSAFNSEDYIIGGLRNSSFNRSAIPMSSSVIRSSNVVSNFINATGVKAMAISPTGGVYSVYSQTSGLTLSEVRRMAIQRCELEAALVPCATYAENNTVVFDPENFVKNSSIDFTNNNVVALAPPASRDSSLIEIQNFLDSIDRDKYFIFITPSGAGYFGSNQSDTELAKTQAQNLCESGAHGSRCIAYASSAGVLIGPDDLKAKANYPELFCKSVRYSCAEHIAMGCTSGAQYWVQDPSTLEAELTSCSN